MPYHDQFAYTDTRCYGVTRAQLGDQTPPQAVTFLAPREIQAVVAFVEDKMKGRGPATLNDCIYIWGTERKNATHSKKPRRHNDPAGRICSGCSCSSPFQQQLRMRTVARSVASNWECRQLP